MTRVVVRGGTVITCDPAGRVGEALCFDEADGRIVASAPTPTCRPPLASAPPRSTSAARRCSQGSSTPTRTRRPDRAAGSASSASLGVFVEGRTSAELLMTTLAETDVDRCATREQLVLGWTCAVPSSSRAHVRRCGDDRAVGFKVSGLGTDAHAVIAEP